MIFEKEFAEDVENVDLRALFYSRIFFWNMWMKEILYNRSRKRKIKNKEINFTERRKQNDGYEF